MGSVRVVTWNVCWRFPPAWRERQRALATRLAEVEPDVVALQECWGTAETTQAHELAGRLGLHAAFVRPGLPPPPADADPDQTGVDVGIGLLSRWPLAAVVGVPMPARHRFPAPVALVAAVRHPEGTLHVVAACTEWEPEFDEDRLAQGAWLAGLGTDPTADGDLPVVVCGDLNAAPDSPVLRPLRETMLDAWTEGGGDPAAVTLPADHPYAPLAAEELVDRRIDHVFVRPGRAGLRVDVDRVGLLGDPVDGVHPSDHRAVLVDLSWEAR